MISGVILAAGSSKRMGTPKQPLKLAGKPMLQHVIDAFLASSLGEVVVVLNPALEWKPRKRRRLRLVANPRSDEGISTSIRVGVQSTHPKSNAAIIGLGDKPLLLASTIEKIIEAYRESPSEIVVPVYRGQRGNPILFRRRLYGELGRLKGDVGAKALIKRKENVVLELPVDDAGVVFDVDREADLRAARKLLSARARLTAERESRK